VLSWYPPQPRGNGPRVKYHLRDISCSIDRSTGSAPNPITLWFSAELAIDLTRVPHGWVTAPRLDRIAKHARTWAGTTCLRLERVIWPLVFLQVIPEIRDLLQSKFNRTSYALNSAQSAHKKAKDALDAIGRRDTMQLPRDPSEREDHVLRHLLGWRL
jgi:hypothetical protein